MCTHTQLCTHVYTLTVLYTRILTGVPVLIRYRYCPENPIRILKIRNFLAHRRMFDPAARWGIITHVIMLNLVITYYSILCICTRVRLDWAPDFRGKKDALGQNAPQSGPECQGGGGTTAYLAHPHAPDGAPTVGAAQIGRGAVLERRAVT
jgi:hypothetical protein